MWVFVILSFLWDPKLISSSAYSSSGWGCSQQRAEKMSLEIEELNTEPRAEKVTVVCPDNLMTLSLYWFREHQLTGLPAWSLTKEFLPELSSWGYNTLSPPTLSLYTPLRSTTEPAVSMFISARRDYMARGARIPTLWSTSWTPCRGAATSRRTTSRRMSSRKQQSRTLIKLSTSKYWNLIL